MRRLAELTANLPLVHALADPMLRRSCARAIRRAVCRSRALLSSSAKAAAAPVALRFQEFKKHPSPPAAAPLVVLHGLLGQSNNWRSIAQRPEIAGDRRVLCADLRNHGDSPHSQRFDYASLVADLVAFLDSQSLPSAILLGHSLGGRAAMATALLRPDRVQRLIVGERTEPVSLMSHNSSPAFAQRTLRLLIIRHLRAGSLQVAL